GQGGMGSAHRRKLVQMAKMGEPVRVVAVCDVWEKRLDLAAKEAGAKPYKDYRRLLEDKDVDAVLIATPDHWHARITIDAAEAGKDIYCEKPMTYWKDLGDAKRVVQTVERHGRVMQVGTNGLSDSIWWQARERVQAGALGKLIHAQASDMRNGPIGVYDARTNDPDAKPGENLDWNMWLGPAPKRPWQPGRFFAFRIFWDYSGGITTDFFPHLLTPLICVMGLKFPKRVASTGGLYCLHERGGEVPDIINVTIEYPEGPSVLLVGSVTNDTTLPGLIRGSKATLKFREGGGAVIEPQASAGKDVKGEEIVRERPGSLDEHWRDFLGCIKSRKKPRSNEVIGYYVMTALHMAVSSYRDGRGREFDAEKERVRIL
ncbi:Gfo/Idh/MocA family oxidoreductase, partial [Candidatus Sumerlaeota bacterium]|nr:Gfo/Idh/MocA family oxidoreductase [Candidatus Sumerlaeota bacterium]